MRTTLALSAALVLISCVSQTPMPVASPSTATVVDCGSSDLRAPDAYDGAAADCFWGAYKAAKPARWAAVRATVEGDSIPGSISFDGHTFLVTRDMTADRFMAASDRHVWSWRCATITQKPWTSDSKRYGFVLSDCTGGAGPDTAFP